MATEKSHAVFREMRSEQECHDFSALVAGCRLPLLRLLESRVEDKHVAEDILQGAILNAWTKFHQLRDKDGFYSWLRSIALTLYARHVRTAVRNQKKLTSYHEKYRNILTGLVESDNPERKAIEKEEMRVAQAVFRMLPLQYQEVCELHHIRGLTILQISRMLGLHSNTVKQRLAKARQIILQKRISFSQ